MNEQLTVHGSIFYLLKKFVGHSQPDESWDHLLSEAHIKDCNFELTKSYPLETLGTIVKAAAEKTGFTSEKLKETFGEYMVPDLFKMYKHYLQPEWKTYEILLKTEAVMHGAVRKLNSTANPPILSVSEVSDELLMIDYYSKRKMGSVAMGIIKGIAKYYGEENKVSVEMITSPEAERVQIKVHFAKS